MRNVHRGWYHGHRADKPYQHIADVVKLLTSPMRLEILVQLHRTPMTVTQLQDCWPNNHYRTVLYHLNILRCANLADYDSNLKFHIYSTTEWGSIIAETIEGFSAKIEAGLHYTEAERAIHARGRSIVMVRLGQNAVRVRTEVSVGARCVKADGA